MKFLLNLSCLLVLSVFSFMGSSYAVGAFEGKKQDQNAANNLAPHKALYDIQLVTTRSGSQVINISGQMYYDWRPSCEGWITDHRFTLVYEYADSPGMKITSDFSTFEGYDGKTLNFSARRKRDSILYQELRGSAQIDENIGLATFTMPEDLKFDLEDGVLFPMAHTIEMVKQAQSGGKFFQSTVFDGSDEEGPVSINAFIGKPVNALQKIEPSENLDMGLLNTSAWNIRMAVFPKLAEESSSDYEMEAILHENGIISDMLIEYDDFSVTQKLVALERIEPDNCLKN